MNLNKCLKQLTNLLKNKIRENPRNVFTLGREYIQNFFCIEKYIWEMCSYNSAYMWVHLMLHFE